MTTDPKPELEQFGHLTELVPPDLVDDFSVKLEAQLDQLLGTLAAQTRPGESAVAAMNREGAHMANAFYESALELVESGFETNAALANQIAHLAAPLAACGLRLNRLDPA